jgi:hypothetical protein
MLTRNSLRVVLATALLIGAAGGARADYYSNAELRPARRCKDIPSGIGDASDPGGPGSLHCQRLFWDLPVTTTLGAEVIGAPYAEDTVPRFPNGDTDRIPPMWVGKLKANVDELNKLAGEIEGFEYEGDCTANSVDGTCQRLCADPLDIPYWQELNDPDGDPITAIHSSRHGVNEEDGTSTGQLQTGQVFKLECRRGSRSYYGPWQTGGKVDPLACQHQLGSDTDAVAGACQGPIFDRLAATQPIRFENSDRLTDDVAHNGTPADKRLEWNMATEYYNHFASHHGTCYQPTVPCTDVQNPPPGSEYSETDPAAQCYNYERASAPGSTCYAGDADPRACCHDANGDCPDKVDMGGFRNATQLPGRLSVPLPDGRGVLATEDIVWGCNHHVVTQLPPGSYSMTRLANYRLQQHGIRNPSLTDTIYGTAPGAEFGGAVGEMILQYFAKPMNADVKPVNANFNALADAATTFYPPFTWQYHEAEWLPPFDSQVAIMAIHSHHRMVKGTMNVAPVNPPRPNDTDPTCGGPKADGSPATDLYTDWFWEDAPVCQYWKQKDGPVPLRKGESLRTTCYVNNGVTPEAIKHGLVAGAAVEALKALGAPIPDYPALVPASTWGDPLVKSNVGKELLYGTHPPINYRVVYKCSTAGLEQVPGGSMVGLPTGIGDTYAICTPNPEKDGDGDYVDGAYRNDVQCGNNDGVPDSSDGLCEPSMIVFACIGEDEMCIGVALYWAMPRLGNPDTNDEAMQNLQDGLAALQSGDTDTAQKKLNNVGLPGSTSQPTDYPAGNCAECTGPGL